MFRLQFIAGEPKIGEFVFLVIMVAMVVVVFMVTKMVMVIIIIGYKTCKANLASPRCQKECRVLDIRLPFDLRRQQYVNPSFTLFPHQTFFPRGGEVPVHPHLNSDN